MRVGNLWDLLGWAGANYLGYRRGLEERARRRREEGREQKRFDWEARLRDLQIQREQGLISDEEYERKTRGELAREIESPTMLPGTELEFGPVAPLRLPTRQLQFGPRLTEPAPLTVGPTALDTGPPQVPQGTLFDLMRRNAPAAAPVSTEMPTRIVPTQRPDTQRLPRLLMRLAIARGEMPSEAVMRGAGISLPGTPVLPPLQRLLGIKELPAGTEAQVPMLWDLAAAQRQIDAEDQAREAAAQRRYGRPFAQLAPAEQEDVLAWTQPELLAGIWSVQDRPLKKQIDQATLGEAQARLGLTQLELALGLKYGGLERQYGIKLNQAQIANLNAQAAHSRALAARAGAEEGLPGWTAAEARQFRGIQMLLGLTQGRREMRYNGMTGQMEPIEVAPVVDPRSPNGLAIQALANQSLGELLARKGLGEIPGEGAGPAPPYKGVPLAQLPAGTKTADWIHDNGPTAFVAQARALGNGDDVIARHLRDAGVKDVDGFLRGRDASAKRPPNVPKDWSWVSGQGWVNPKLGPQREW